MLTLINVKFLSLITHFSASSGDKGMFSSVDILQITDVICQVVFLLFF